jgi:hypothetical protein
LSVGAGAFSEEELINFEVTLRGTAMESLPTIFITNFEVNGLVILDQELTHFKVPFECCTV